MNALQKLRQQCARRPVYAAGLSIGLDGEFYRFLCRELLRGRELRQRLGRDDGRASSRLLFLEARCLARLALPVCL